MLSIKGWKRIAIRSSAIVSKQDAEQGVQNVVNINKIKFEPYGDVVDQIYSKCNETLINNQDPQSQIENDENPGAANPIENDS